MPQLPDVTSIGRALPQSRRPIVSYQPDQLGNEIAGISSQVVEGVDKIELAQGKLQVSYAEANLLRKKVDLLNSFDNDQDYATFQQRYEKEMAAAKDEQLKGISRADIRSGFDAYATQFIAGGLNEVQDKARRKQQDYTVASLMENSAAQQDAYLSADPKTAAQIARNVNMMYDAARDSGAISAVEAAKAKIGWANEIKRVRQQRAAEAIKLQQEDEKLRMSDPAAWGRLHNKPLDEIVQMQQGSVYASVLGKDEAKQIVQKVKAGDAGGITSFAQQIKQQYGDYSSNALLDLKAAGLPDAHEAAINLAIDNPVGNSEYIALFSEVAKVGSKTLNETYKSTALGNPDQVDEEVIANLNESASAMLNEGYGFDEVTRHISVTSDLAKAYQIKNPSVSASDAAEFASKMLKNNYKVAELNGTKYRVPLKYDADAIEKRLEQHFEDVKFNLPGSQDSISKNAQDNLKKLAMPFLNKSRDGVQFRAPDGEILLDKDGKPAELKFDDIISKPTPYEKRQEKINASFEDREPRF